MSDRFSKALEEIKFQKEKYDKLYREFYSMKIYVNTLEKEIKSLKDKAPSYVIEADKAMRKYTAKLRKELQDAKQKQS